MILFLFSGLAVYFSLNQNKHMETQTLLHETATHEPELILVQASGGQRFANYLIDLVGFFALLFFWGILLALVKPSAVDALNYSDNDVSASLLDRIITMVIFAVYMGLIEGIFKGKSLGKLITGTKAVNEYDGSDISFGTAFTRGFSRLVPFEAFSALGNPSYPWHDKWSNTIVIDEKETRRQSNREGAPW
jgi:uncharacterized RDD family membrane protein YckC